MKKVLIVALVLLILVFQIGLAKNNRYKPGTYIGYIPNKHGDVVIKVQVNKEKITNVEILNPIKKKGEYPHPPAVKLFKKFPKQVIKKQSVDVDTIAGATHSYHNYVKAVKKALSIAKDEYKGDTYYGISKDYEDHGYVLLKTVINKEKIKDVEIIPAKTKKDNLALDKTKGYPHQPAIKAYKIFPKLAVKNQSVHVDAISGATYSINAYNQALRQALKQAKLNPENY
ncbi:FMN-binding protein [Sporohalobacter salinus]|uniref:FMN-binding protein n=1 Tax=Sporohalobacter salinus TaxID=1494606 RepID=UPI00196168FC|nr:FMN-binding protein [Sporohalobacter salinus]MBM7624732.1 uncharacterized protein with FMN-binding domain [Sporohalobacter salinus]